MDPLQPILLVDDSHDDLFILKRLLSRSGVKNAFITFDHARDAQRFMQSALRTPDTNLIPAAVFSDREMPEFDGLELLKWVRQQTALVELPFILLTSALQPHHQQAAATLGATAFFEKFPSQHVFTELFGT